MTDGTSNALHGRGSGDKRLQRVDVCVNVMLIQVTANRLTTDLHIEEQDSPQLLVAAAAVAAAANSLEIMHRRNASSILAMSCAASSASSERLMAL